MLPVMVPAYDVNVDFQLSNSDRDAFFIFNAACDASFNLLSKCHCL
jgi:hypothetical protein